MDDVTERRPLLLDVEGVGGRKVWATQPTTHVITPPQRPRNSQIDVSAEAGPFHYIQHAFSQRALPNPRGQTRVLASCEACRGSGRRWTRETESLEKMDELQREHLREVHPSWLPRKL